MWGQQKLSPTLHQAKVRYSLHSHSTQGKVPLGQATHPWGTSEHQGLSVPSALQKATETLQGLFWLTLAIQHCCKGRRHFWWQTRADILSTDLDTWLGLCFMLHYQKDTISRDALGWPWGHSLHSKGQVTSSKWLCCRKAGGAAGAVLAPTEGM